MNTTRPIAAPARKTRKRRMARPADPPAVAAPTAPAPAAQPTRLAVLTQLLARPGGATLADLQAESGWQAHSVRGFLAGTLRKKGYTVTSEPAEGGRIYRADLPAGDTGA